MKEKKKINKFVKTFDPKMWFHDFVKVTGAIPAIIYLRLKRIFTGNKKGLFRGSYIISSNHGTFIDPIIIMNAFWVRRVCFVATQDFFEKKFLNLLFRGFGCIPVDKNNPTLKTFNGVSEKLNRGHIVCIFPEGKVTKDSELHTLKSGIVMMAFMNEVPILPIYIAKKDKWYERQKVVIGEKIDIFSYIKGKMPTMDELNYLSILLLEKEKELKEIYDTRKGSKNDL